jgi:hypothetical protein
LFGTSYTSHHIIYIKNPWLELLTAKKGGERRRGALTTTRTGQKLRFMFEEKAMSWRNAWGCCDFTDEVYIITIQEGIDIGFALAFFMAWKVTNQYRN